MGHPFGPLFHFWFAGLAVNPHTEFEVSSRTHFRDIEGSQNYKTRSLEVSHEPSDLLLHFCYTGLTINPHTKFEVSNHSRDMSVSYTHLTLPTNREV